LVYGNARRGETKGTLLKVGKKSRAVSVRRNKVKEEGAG
jgi:hypothetical protein